MGIKIRKKIQQYIKYTTDELNLYAQTEGSCVHKINTNMIVIIRPYCLANFKAYLRNHLVYYYIGRHNPNLDGIILEITNIKLYNGFAGMRADDPNLHIKFNADIFVFKPEVNAILTGIVKHIGNKQVGVIVYRVFNVNLNVASKIEADEVILDKEVKFCIRNFNLQNMFPYIEGELLSDEIDNTVNHASLQIEEVKIKQEVDTDYIEKVKVEKKPRKSRKKLIDDLKEL